MAVTIAAVMRSVRNFFTRGFYRGQIAITGNALLPAQDAPYIAIQGSRHHDGVYRVINGNLQDMSDGMPDETFDGIAWKLYPPVDFISLCQQISAYDDKNPTGAPTSESFGDYSYSRASGPSGTLTWEEAFARRLIPYRRMFSEVDV